MKVLAQFWSQCRLKKWYMIIITILHCCYGDDALAIAKGIKGPGYQWIYNLLLHKTHKIADFINILCALEQQDGKASFYVKPFRDYNNSRR